MSDFPKRIFLDTNIYIIGFADPKSPEAKILKWSGIDLDNPESVEIVVSDEVFGQILRVSKRLRGKDWAGEIVGRIWKHLNLLYILIDQRELIEVEDAGGIPREDIGIYLTARVGKAQCFVSSNHDLIRSLAQQTREFECLTPTDFVDLYLSH